MEGASLCLGALNVVFASLDGFGLWLEAGAASIIISVGIKGGRRTVLPIGVAKFTNDVGAAKTCFVVTTTTPLDGVELVGALLLSAV